MIYHDRADAARQLAQKLRARELRHPLILAIPRGGVVIGAVLAHELNAELDVVLARKLRAPNQPEYAIGAVSEDGQVFLNQEAVEGLELAPEYLLAERRRQLAEIHRRKELFRAIRPAAKLSQRSVIVTDDGIATGSTMIAALQIARLHHPSELLAAAPVAAPDRLAQVRRHCDEAICLLVTREFFGVGQFYEDFRQVSDEEVIELLREAVAAHSKSNPPA